MNAVLGRRFDEGQIRQFIRVITEPVIGCFEVCAKEATFTRSGFIEPFDLYKKMLAGWYDDPSAIVVDAARFKGVSGYIVPNPARFDLLARSPNRITKADSRTKDDDIVALRWLYVDVDSVRPDGISATDDEMAAAVDRRDAILSDHPEILDVSIWGRSGNGAWLLVRLPDYPNDAEHRELVARYIGRMKDRYTDDRAKIDATTKNPARLMPLVGTLKCKGVELASIDGRPARPHRMVTIDGGIS